MNTSHRTFCVLPPAIIRFMPSVAMLMIGIALTGLARSDARALDVDNTANVDRVGVRTALRTTPLLFVQNAGQFDSGARFQVRGANNTIWLAENALWITLLEPTARDEHPDLQGLEGLGGPPADGQPRQGVNLKLSFVGANPHPRLEPFNRLDSHVSYFIGSGSDEVVSRCTRLGRRALSGSLSGD